MKNATLATEKSYPYWAGRVSEALRCVLDVGDDCSVTVARRCLDEFDEWCERTDRDAEVTT